MPQKHRLENYHNTCFSFTPSEIAKKLYFFPSWCDYCSYGSGYIANNRANTGFLFLFLQQGSLTLQYRDTQFLVAEKQAFLLDCKEDYCYSCTNDIVFQSLYFDGSNTQQLVDQVHQLQGIVFPLTVAASSGEVLSRFIQQCIQKELLSAPVLSLYIYQILIFLLFPTPSGGDFSQPVHTAIDFIHENFNQKITLDLLATVTGISKYHFARLFKNETGYSPMEYSISTKLDHAKILLKTTAHSIAAIAAACGYENTGSFINLFTDKVGISPSTFRKL